MGRTTAQGLALSTASVVVAWLSVLTAAFVVVEIERARRRKGSRPVGAILSLVQWMSVADVVWGLKRAVHGRPAHGLCVALGFVGQSSALCSASLNACIALDVWLCWRKPFGHKQRCSARYMPRYKAFSLLMGLGTALAMLAAGVYARWNDGSCWVGPQHPAWEWLFWGPTTLHHLPPLL